jgi:hypothetical protein
VPANTRTSGPDETTTTTRLKQILYKVEEHVLMITLNRQDRLNAWTKHLGLEIAEAFGGADADEKRPPKFPDRVSNGLPSILDSGHEEPRFS